MPADNTLRFIKIDFESHKAAILQRVRSRWPGVWNDFLSNSFGIVLVDLIAYSTSTLAYIVNRLAAENFIPTMRLRESAVRIGALTGYKLRGPAPATVDVEAVIQSPAPAPILISQGTVIRTGDGSVAFEVEQDYTIDTGETTPIIPVIFFSTSRSGENVIQTNAVPFKDADGNFTNFLDLTDTAIDLTLYVSPGQKVIKIDPTDAFEYTIDSISNSEGALDNNRMVLDRPWEGVSGVTAIEVFDRRIALIQGQTVVDSTVSPIIEVQNFQFALSKGPVLDGSVQVNVNGVRWLVVDSLAVQDKDAQVVEVVVDTDGNTAVKFGDGTLGALVPVDAQVETQYRIGGGSDGNILPNTINTSITGLNTALSSPVTIQISNVNSSGQGGFEQEGLEEARINIPAVTKTQDRGVGLGDYQTLAARFSSPQFGQIRLARASVRTQNSLLEGNLVVIKAWTSGTSGGYVPIGQGLKLALKDYLDTKRVGTDDVLLADGTSRPIPIAVRFRVFDGFDVTTTRGLVLDTLNKISASLKPGDPVIFSDLVRNMDEVFGVNNLVLATPITDLQTQNPDEVFGAPNDEFSYPLRLASAGGLNYVAQSPILPLTAWSFRLFISGNELDVIPDIQPGYARVLGQQLNPNLVSRVNLVTGKVEISGSAPVGSLTLRLITAQGFDRTRNLDVFIGYRGVDTLAKRREIRGALRSWADGLKIGGTVFAKEIASLPRSKSNITDVVQAISGVVEVSRVAMGSPTSGDDRVNLAETENVSLQNIILNNFTD